MVNMVTFPTEQLFEAAAGVLKDFASMINHIGNFGLAVINIFLGLVDYQLPEKISLGIITFNTSLFFNVAVTAIAFYYIMKTAPEFLSKYFKWIVVTVAIVIGLSILSNFI